MTTTTNTIPNFADKTLWTGDNLDILRGLNSACVDLTIEDPQPPTPIETEAKAITPKYLAARLREINVAA